MILQTVTNGITILRLQNNHLEVCAVPAAGGKILSIYNRAMSREFLWTAKNAALATHNPGADYDSNFIGGIDELIPNDIPEFVDGNDYPDHGELWTRRMEFEVTNDQSLSMQATLPLSGLHYQKKIYLDAGKPVLYQDYIITNHSGQRRHFLWKLHAALNIHPGDKLVTKAAKARVADTAYSRFADTATFAWPFIEGVDASIVPVVNNDMDFFYLYGLPEGNMQLVSDQNNTAFIYSYDKTVFPFQWYFASYGGFQDHYTAVLEPCTSMPIILAEAIKQKQCSVLEPGEAITTTVSIYAGPKK